MLGSYKFFLLNIMLTSYVLDVYLSIILIPFPLLPLAGYCTLGLMRFAGIFWGGIIGIMLMIIFLGMCGASIIIACMYRLAAIYNWQRNMVTSKAVTIYVLFHLLLTSPLLAIGAFVIAGVMDQESIQRLIFEQNPGVRQVGTANLCVYAPLENNVLMKLAVCVAMVILLIIGAIGVTMLAIGVISLGQRKRIMSRKSFKMHQQLIMSLVLQMCVPFITLFVPFSMVAVCLFLQLPYVKNSAQIMSCMACSHSYLNAIVMIICTRPYRDVLLKWVKKATELVFRCKKVQPDKVKTAEVNTIFSSRLSVDPIIASSPLRKVSCLL
uniref:G protein-coupled receptor n=1 Tax=Ditylenchus dipsaci TaxID=166011 RepID=A0A915DQV0_9BILA